METTTRTDAPVFPLCLCGRCGITFRDPYEIYPGPDRCPECARMDREAWKRKQKKARR